MLQGYFQRLDNYSDNDTDEAIQDEILVYANANREVFIAEVYAISPEQFYHLDDIYEALTGDPTSWADFFVEEIDRLFTLARENPDPAAIVQPLDAFWLISQDEDALQLRKTLLEHFSNNLGDENVMIRRKCVVLTGDLATRNDFRELNKLEELVKEDSDWRVRYLAFQALEDIHPKRAQRVRLPRWIRLRARFSNIDLE